MKRHSCIVAFHIGHSTIKEREANIENICNTCCGGVMLLDHCPICGKRIENKRKYIKWQTIARRKDVKIRIKSLKTEEKLSNFAESVLECYQKELKELNDAVYTEGVKE